jgi:enoyl-CoA hydratase/carnithine racemase
VTLRLNQPEARNALSLAMVRRLHDALTRAGQDAAVTAVVMLGTGDAFSAGADLRSFLVDGPPLAQALRRRDLGTLFLLLEAYRKPLVAAVNGDALGAGFGLVAACHLAVAVPSARFGLPGVRLGIMPMTIMPVVFRTLPRKVGLELMLTGRLMDAPEALGCGFINAVAPADALSAAAARLALDASNRPLTIGV